MILGNNKHKMFYGETVMLILPSGLVKSFDFSKEHESQIRFSYCDFKKTYEVGVVIRISGKEYTFPIYEKIHLPNNKNYSYCSSMIKNSIIESEENNINVISRFIDCSVTVMVYENNFEILDECKRLAKECLNYSSLAYKEVKANGSYTDDESRILEFKLE